MRCPQCQKVAPDDAAFCPSCDAILDASFLGDDVLGADAPTDGGHGDGTDTMPRAIPGAGGGAHTDGAGLRAKAGELAAPPDFDQLATDAVRWWRSLPACDRLAIAAAGATIVLCFFPWVYVEREGSLAGIQLGGWLPLLVAALVAGLVWMRSALSLGVGAVWVQLSVSMAAVIFCAYRAIDPAASVELAGGPADPVVSTRISLLLACAATVLLAVASWMALALPPPKRSKRTGGRRG